eukprot:TRINITY_DN780_c0_g1_i3.p4 TRINITY_DN780_c0_g1~~TRINITY_DN780_c0_g1_i3.p4  ORF type:complete len:281 (-),score=12.96 TRINITY_DN780_c0_g1_i3:1698-2540(-)
MMQTKVRIFWLQIVVLSQLSQNIKKVIISRPPINSYSILDKPAAVKELDNEDLFEFMLNEFIRYCLNTHLLSIKMALDDFDYQSLMFHCNSLKSSAGYIHAMRVKVAAKWCSEDVKKRNLTGLIRDYAEVVRQSICLRQHIILELMKHKRMFCKGIEALDIKILEIGSTFDVPLSDMFVITETPPYGFDVILREHKKEFPKIPKYGSSSPRVGIAGLFNSEEHVHKHTVDTSTKKKRKKLNKNFVIAKKCNRKKMTLVNDDKVEMEDDQKVVGCICIVFQ